MHNFLICSRTGTHIKLCLQSSKENKDEFICNVFFYQKLLNTKKKKTLIVHFEASNNIVRLNGLSISFSLSSVEKPNLLDNY